MLFNITFTLKHCLSQILNSVACQFGHSGSRPVSLFLCPDLPPACHSLLTVMSKALMMCYLTVSCHGCHRACLTWFPLVTPATKPKWSIVKIHENKNEFFLNLNLRLALWLRLGFKIKKRNCRNRWFITLSVVTSDDPLHRPVTWSYTWPDKASSL